jgi:hypothetical protein
MVRGLGAGEREGARVTIKLESSVSEHCLPLTRNQPHCLPMVLLALLIPERYLRHWR